MNVIIANEIEKSHLAEVKEEMVRLGAPVVRAVYVEAYDAWVAFEGSHRVVAAKELGLVPVIEEVKYEDIVDENGEDKVAVSELSGDLDIACSIDEFISSAAERPFVEF